MARAQFLSPGPLSRGHAEVEGDAACGRCHEGGHGISVAQCNSCHRPIERRIAAGQGYHGRVARSEPCNRCHLEHMGADASLVRWPGGSPEAFNHGQAGFALEGEHARAACRDCHQPRLRTGAEAADLPEKSYLGLPTACAPCHKADDPHQGQFGGKACSACHGPAGWKRLAGFDHQRTRFPLREKHADVPCAKCHVPPSAKGGATRYAGLETACKRCHEAPHPKTPAFQDDCAACHSAKGFAPAALVTYDRARHPKLPLTGGHAKPACADCHKPKVAENPAVACAGCHADAHAGRFGRKCDRCHTVEAWSALRKDAQIDHDRTDFPLRGAHEELACEACHPDGRLKPIDHERCRDCHDDPHGGEVGKRCEDCHDVAGFVPSTYPLARHKRFGLDGAHRAVACDACHRPRPPGKRGRAGARAPLDFRRGAAACADCHRDPHDAQFAPRPCQDCHSTKGFDGAGFAHTVFPLEGLHAVAACTSCHADGRFAGTPRGCRDCHGDPHLGQFALEGAAVRDCADCHSPRGWRGGYDHGARWPLDGRHAAAACAACHREISLPGGRSVIRYRLGFNDCARCHENVHARDAGRAPGTFDRCEACHAPTAWRALVGGGGRAFDHGATGFALRGRHAEVACARCHTGGTLRGAACATCHADPHAARNGDRCDACHTPQSWRLPEAAAVHARTRLPLQGAHLSIPCRDCHRGAARDLWDGLDARCAACHKAPASARPPHKGAPFTTRCDECHTPFGFAPAALNHARYWPLEGRHRSAACADCHRNDRYAGLPTACVHCHRDDLRTGHPAGESDACGACHAPTGWKSVRGFEHGRLFPLPHRSVAATDCKACHPVSDRAFTCTGCHAHARGGAEGADRRHAGVPGYVYGDRGCLRCHPRGT